MLEDRLTQIIENILHENSPQSIRLQVSIEQSRDSLALSLRQTYIETVTGRRYFDEKVIVPNGRVSRKTSYHDGSKCANVRYAEGDVERQQVIAVGHEFMGEGRFGFRDAPPPLRYGHVGLVPLHEALPTAEPMGQDQVIGRTCDVFHFRDAGPADAKQSLVYCLDKETSIPLKVTAYANPDRVREGSPNWVWEATSFETISGRHFPLSSTYAGFAGAPPGEGQGVAKPIVTQAIQVKEIAFDADIPRSTFWPAFQPGVTVLNAITKRSYTVPGGPSPAGETAQAGPPIRVVESGGGYWLTGAGLILSLSVLGVAFVMWRRSR